MGNGRANTPACGGIKVFFSFSFLKVFFLFSVLCFFVPLSRLGALKWLWRPLAADFHTLNEPAHSPRTFFTFPQAAKVTWPRVETQESRNSHGFACDLAWLLRFEWN